MKPNELIIFLIAAAVIIFFIAFFAPELYYWYFRPAIDITGALFKVVVPIVFVMVLGVAAISIFHSLFK